MCGSFVGYGFNAFWEKETIALGTRMETKVSLKMKLN